MSKGIFGLMCDGNVKGQLKSRSGSWQQREAVAVTGGNRRNSGSWYWQEAGKENKAGEVCIDSKWSKI